MDNRQCVCSPNMALGFWHCRCVDVRFGIKTSAPMANCGCHCDHSCSTVDCLRACTMLCEDT